MESVPESWLELKTEIRAFFKPDNSISVARDKIRNLRQTNSIAQYVQDFMTIKLSIPRMSDEEAVDKFIAGLKSPAARIYIKDNTNIEHPVLSEVIRAAHIYEGNRSDGTASSHRSSNSLHDNQVDDPMDLSMAEQRELYNMMKSSWNNLDSAGYRGGFRGGFRGGYRSGFRGRGGGAHRGRGDNFGGRSVPRDNIKCYKCSGFGHIERDCPSFKGSHQLNYTEAEDYADDYNNYNYDNKNNNSSAYLYCVLPTSRSYVEPLLMDEEMMEKDVQFVLNAGGIDTKLPLYQAFVNGVECSVLIDSGASANYINPKLLAVITKIRHVFGSSGLKRLMVINPRYPLLLPFFSKWIPIMMIWRPMSLIQNLT